MSSVLPIDQIKIDGGTQSRAGLNRATIEEYAEAMKEGATFPPVDVFYDGQFYWLWDGFHRREASIIAARTSMDVRIQQGSQRDAILASVGANAKHGLRRTFDDKRRGVLALLRDDEWSQWSDREIARRCNVSHPFVAKLRTELTGNVSSEERTYTTKHGSVATMNTANIGRTQESSTPMADIDLATNDEQINAVEEPEWLQPDTGTVTPPVPEAAPPPPTPAKAEEAAPPPPPPPPPPKPKPEPKPDWHLHATIRPVGLVLLTLAEQDQPPVATVSTAFTRMHHEAQVIINKHIPANQIAKMKILGEGQQVQES